MPRRAFANYGNILLIVPSHKGFHCCIFCKPKARIKFCSICISLFGSLPKLSCVGSLKWDRIFLGLVNEYSETFFQYLFRAHGYRHFYFSNIPFLPCSLVQPYPAIFDPVISCRLYPFNDSNTISRHTLCVHADRPGRLRNIPGEVYLAEKLHDLNILLSHRLLLNSTGFIKAGSGNVPVISQTYVTAGCFCFTSPYESFNISYIGSICCLDFFCAK